MMRAMKNKKGFTLVEVIVVAIIVLVLAAVAIPLYNNYITSSADNAAANVAASGASFCGACVAAGGAPAYGTNKFTCGGADGNTSEMPVDPTITITLTTATKTVKAVAAKGSAAGVTRKY